MKRAGFTMIELIFVIVILGILSAIALPKFLGVADQAKAGKLTAYVGTLNTTTLPSIWAKAIMDGNGSIADYTSDITTNLKVPDEISVDFSKLEASSFEFNTTSSPSTGKIVGEKKYGSSTYQIVCKDGNTTNQPQCDIYNKEKSTWILADKY